MGSQGLTHQARELTDLVLGKHLCLLLLWLRLQLLCNNTCIVRPGTWAFCGSHRQAAALQASQA